MKIIERIWAVIDDILRFITMRPSRAEEEARREVQAREEKSHASHVLPELPQTIAQRLYAATTVRQCLDLYYEAEETDPVRSEAVEKIKKLPTSFGEMLGIYRDVSATSVLGMYAREQLISRAASFSDWRLVHDLAGADAELDALAIDKLILLAEAADQFAEVYEMAEGTSKQEEILAKLRAKTQSYEDWKDVFENAAEGGSLEGFAAEQLIALAADAATLIGLLEYSQVCDDEALRGSVIARLQTMEMSFSEWKELDDSSNPNEVDDVITEKLFETTRSMEDLYALADLYADNGSSAEVERVREKARAILQSPDDIRKTFDDRGNEDPVLDVAVEKFLERATTAIECLELYREANEDWDTTDYDDAIFTRLFALATPAECAIIVKVANLGETDRDALAAEAEKHVS